MRNQKYKSFIKYFKKNAEYKEYKSFFHHKVTRFVIIYIIAFFYKDDIKKLDNDKIAKLEMKLTKKNDIKSFSNTFNELKDILPKEYVDVNWKEFGKYFYYLWQTSRFYYDKKHHLKNIYTIDNHIILNKEKRKCYYIWQNSYKDIDLYFNKFILYLKNKGI